MNLDDLKTSWQEHHDDLAKERCDDLVTSVAERTDRLEFAVWQRDLIEAIATLIVVGTSIYFLCAHELPLVMKLGTITLVLSGTMIVSVMFWTRICDERPSRDLPLLEFCVAERVRLDRQIRMLRTAVWWYTLPLLGGLSLITVGGLSALTELPQVKFYGFTIAFGVAFLATGIVLYRAHNHSARTRFAPTRDALAELERSLRDSPDDL